MDKLQRAISPSTWASLTSSTPCGSCVCLFSPQIIGGYASFLYQIGLLDERQRKYFQKLSEKCVRYIKEEEWFQAFEVSPGAHVARSNENHLRGPGSTTCSGCLLLLEKVYLLRRPSSGGRQWTPNEEKDGVGLL